MAVERDGILTGIKYPKNIWARGLLLEHSGNNSIALMEKQAGKMTPVHHSSRNLKVSTCPTEMTRESLGQNKDHIELGTP